MFYLQASAMTTEAEITHSANQKARGLESQLSFKVNLSFTGYCKLICTWCRNKNCCV
jgi:hypothetical protein